jgi:hypothetical protein
MMHWCNGGHGGVWDARPYLLRDYLWLEVQRWLQDEAPVFCAEDRTHCEDLAGELASVTFQPNSNGLLVVEDKDSIRKRLGRSPDLADGLGNTFAPGGYTLPAVNMAAALDLRQRPLAQRAMQPPMRRYPREATADARDQALYETLRQRWGLRDDEDDAY